MSGYQVPGYQIMSGCLNTLPVHFYIQIWKNADIECSVMKSILLYGLISSKHLHLDPRYFRYFQFRYLGRTFRLGNFVIGIECNTKISWFLGFSDIQLKKCYCIRIYFLRSIILIDLRKWILVFSKFSGFSGFQNY